MLKGSKNSKIIIPNEKVLELTKIYIEINDDVEEKNQLEIFKMIYIDKEQYTLVNIAKETSYSESSVTRSIRQIKLAIEKSKKIIDKYKL